MIRLADELGETEIRNTVNEETTHVVLANEGRRTEKVIFGLSYGKLKIFFYSFILLDIYSFLLYHFLLLFVTPA